MNLGAGVAWASDARSRRRMLAVIEGEEFGFQRAPSGAWTWRLWQARTLLPASARVITDAPAHM